MVYLIKCSLCECNYIVIPHRDFLISVWCVCLESVCHWECSWCAVLKRHWPTAWLVFILDSLPSEDGAFCPAQAQYWYLLEKTIHQGTGEALKGYCQVPVFGFSKTGLSFFFFFLNPLEAINWIRNAWKYTVFVSLLLVLGAESFSFSPATSSQYNKSS